MQNEELIGNTGKRGYEVPHSVTQTGIQIFGHYIKKAKYGQKGEKVWVHGSLRVPVNIEELVCRDTGDIARSPIPEAHREHWKHYCKKPKQEIRDRPNQFDVVAWQCELTDDRAEGYETDDSEENIEIGPWRMGYVINDYDKLLRVMIPSGRLYYLRPERVVFFNNMAHSVSTDVDDTEWNVSRYDESDWDFSADYEDRNFDISNITNFVKDKSYPLEEQTPKRKHTTSDRVADGVALFKKRSVEKVGNPSRRGWGASRGGWATTWENRQPPQGRTWTERLQPRHDREKLVVGDCKGADELCGRV